MPYLHMLLKQKSPSLPRKSSTGTFDRMLIVFSTKVNLLNLYSTDDSGIFLSVFPSRTNLKLHNIPITSKMVKKVITNLDSSNASGPNCIPMVVLSNCEPELSYILAELFNMCLKEPCFPDFWKVSSVVSVFKNAGERSSSMISNVFEKLVNNKVVDYLEICGLFSDFQYGFSRPRSTADFLTVASDRIARVFNRSGATRTVALNVSNAFGRV